MKDTIVVKKEKGNPYLNRLKKSVLKDVEIRFGWLFAAWLSVQAEDIDLTDIIEELK